MEDTNTTPGAEAPVEEPKTEGAPEVDANGVAQEPAPGEAPAQEPAPEGEAPQA